MFVLCCILIVAASCFFGAGMNGVAACLFILGLLAGVEAWNRATKDIKPTTAKLKDSTTTAQNSSSPAIVNPPQATGQRSSSPAIVNPPQATGQNSSSPAIVNPPQATGQNSSSPSIVNPPQTNGQNSASPAMPNALDAYAVTNHNDIYLQTLKLFNSLRYQSAALLKTGLHVRTGGNYSETLSDLETVACNLQKIHRAYARLFFYFRASKSDPNYPWEYHACEVRFGYSCERKAQASRLFKQLNLGDGLYLDGASIKFETTDVSGWVNVEALPSWNNAYLMTFEAWGFYGAEGTGGYRELDNGELVWSWSGELYC